MATGNMGALVLELQGNIARIEKDMREMSRVVGSGMKEIDRVAATTSRNISAIGTAGGGIKRIEGARQAANDIDKIGHSSTGARREILVLAHELSQGNLKRAAGSLMVLGERMDWMGKIMSPVGLAVGAVAGAALALAAAAYKGAQESSAFAKSLVLTGDYAGLTEGRFNALATTVAAASNVTIGNAREISQELVTTGRFGSDSLAHVAVAAAMLAEVSGEKSEEIVKHFEHMADGPLRFALEMDKSTHFMTGALYEQIKALDDAGDREKAMTVIADAVTDSLKRQGYQVDNTGLSWKGFKAWVSGAVDSLEDFLGRADTASARLSKLRSELKNLEDARAHAPPGLSGAYDSRIDDVQKRIGRNTALERNQSDNADLVSFQKHTNEMVVAAKTRWDELSKTHKVGAELLKEELAEAARVGQQSGQSPADIAAMQDRIRKGFNHGSSNANALNRADLNEQLKPLQDQITAEDRLLVYREQVLSKYYKNGLISEQGYYDTRATVLQANSVRIKALYDQQIASVEAAAAKASDAAKKKELTTQADRLRDEQQQALLRSSEALDLLTIEQAADTEKYRAAVEKLNSELGKLDGKAAANAGADFDRTHADLRKKATAANDTGTLDTLTQARTAAIAQAEMNQLKQQAQQITDALGIVEKRVTMEEVSGQKLILEGDAEISKARTAAAAQLEQIAAKMQQIAGASGLPTMVNQAAEFKLKTDEIADSADVMGKQFNTTFANGFATILDNTISKTKTLKQSFLDFANSLEQSITRLISQDLFNKLFSVGNGSSGGSTSGISQLIGWAIGLMAGGASGSENIGASATSTPDDLISGYRASGGPTMAGGMYEVNERGPELLTYANRTFLMMGDQPGKVTPMNGSNQGGGGNTFHMNIAVPAGTTRQTAQQQAREIMTQAQIAQARNG